MLAGQPETLQWVDSISFAVGCGYRIAGKDFLNIPTTAQNEIAKIRRKLPGMGMGPVRIDFNAVAVGLTRFKWDVAHSGPIVAFSWVFGR